MEIMRNKTAYTPPLIEEWRDIPEYKGVYQASNLGRIMSLPRIDCGGRRWQAKILAQHKVKGYYKTGLHHAGTNRMCSVHRLVASAFLPNPNNYPEVNHKDEDPLNNHVENLEWCDRLYNYYYGTARVRAAATRSIRLKGRIPHPEQQKPVAKISITSGEVLMTYPSASEAARQCGLRESKISLVCNCKRHTTGGYKWKYL